MNRRFLFCIVVELILGLSVESSIIEDDITHQRKIRDATDEVLTKISYDGNQLWRTTATDDADKRVIVSLKRDGHISTWGGNQTNLDILVKPQAIDLVRDALKNKNIQYEVVIDNLQEAIDAENPPIADNEDRQGHRMTWNAYHRARDIWGYLDYLSQTYPKICQVINIGFSYEHRPLKVLKISNGNKTNKAVWIDGGVHAREWISPAAVTYIINYLTSHFDNEMQNIDYYIAPLMNPDGYEYTHKVDRIWRKNRRPNGVNSEYRCIGTDINRNFGYKWGADGSSNDPCQETYGGPRAFSELETSAMKKFIQETRVSWKAYISFHSYGQYILYPWGYVNAITEDYNDLDTVGRKAAAAVRLAGGPGYIVGPAASTLYPAAGGSDDWAKGSMRMKYSYTVELRDSGRYGFILPSKYIKESSKDALEVMRVIVEAASKA